MLKRAFSATAAMLTLAAFTVFPARARGGETGLSDIDVSARCAILMDAGTGTVLYEKAPDEPRQIASTTKLMTALVCLERCRMEDTVEVPPEAEGVEGSSMYLKAGEVLTVRELMYGLLLESGNDAAAALAIHASGSIGAFAKLMNEKAAALGLENTHYMNPHGLTEEGHYSTARDLAKLMAVCMSNPLYEQIATTRSVSFGSRSFKNHNRLMWSFDGMLTGKTGYTMAAGRTLVTCAQRNGMRLICVTLDDGDDFDDHAALYDAAFAGWYSVTVPSTTPVASVPVISGTEDEVQVRPAAAVRLLCPVGTEPVYSVKLPEFVYAAVHAGDRAGVMTVTVGGESADVELVYCRDVPRDESQRLRPLERLRRLIFGEAGAVIPYGQ